MSLSTFFKRQRARWSNPGAKPMANNVTPIKTTTQPPLTTYQRNQMMHASLVNDGLADLLELPEFHTLKTILMLNRASGGRGEEILLQQFFPDDRFTADDYGNRFLVIPQDDGRSPHVMFTCHIDTVSTNPHPTYLPLCYNKAKDVLFRNDGNVLGADDGTGIWLLLSMIENQVPGLYCFFRDEEAGRLGSEHSLDKYPKLYHNVRVCVSFDRRGTDDVVTFQRGTRCCSDTFADALADALNDADLSFKYKGGARGSFTDSATFMGTIPECCNIAVGYDAQHTDRETQLVGHLFKLKDALNKVDWHALPVERDPAEAEDDLDDAFGNYGNAYWRNWNGYSGASTTAANTAKNDLDLDDQEQLDNQLELNHIASLDTQGLIEEYSDLINDLLMDLGWSGKDIREYIVDILGLDATDTDNELDTPAPAVGQS